MELTIQQAAHVLDGYPHLDLGHFPTPVRELARLRQHLGCAPRLWIKNDDYSGPAFGGNKVRKLEYVLARAIEDGVDLIFTAGGITSNHARITAGLCARLGIECVLVLNVPQGQPLPTQGRPASLWMDELFGARVHVVERREDRTNEMERLAAQAAADGRRPMVVPIGASTPLGALGFVRAAREFAAQAEEQSLNVRAIVHVSSSGGTQAGLVAGMRLFGAGDAKTIGISVDDPAPAIAETVHKIFVGVHALLELPTDAASSADLMRDVIVDDRFTGPGYAIPSPEGEEALSLLARTEGVILDPVYTAKGMAGFLEYARNGGFAANDDIVFWHTGGQLALFQENL